MARLVVYLCVGLLLAAVLSPPPLHAQEDISVDARLRKLETALSQMQQQLAERDRQIEQLERQQTALRQSLPEPSLTAAERERLDLMLAHAHDADDDHRQLTFPGSSAFRLIDLSGVLNVAAGGSTATNEELDLLQAGAHDPRQRGFNFQQLELSIAGAVDPFFAAEAHIVYSEHGAEVEEAFATTTSLPSGLQVRAGYYLTEFGRINPSHPHNREWLDEPVVNTRLFGGEGMRGAGARVSWLSPLPWYSEFQIGMQNAGGDFMTSFAGEADAHDEHGEEGEDEHETTVGGWPAQDRDVSSLSNYVYAGRWVNALDLNDRVSAQLGISGLYGPNRTGSSGHTLIYGTDLVVKYHPAGSSLRRPRLTWQSELMRRDFHADEATTDEGFLAGDTLRDWGLYSQVLLALDDAWSVGMRYDYASGSGDSVHEIEREDRATDPFRGDRHRVSPLLIYQPTEFTRLRLQYNYDRADFLDRDDAHSLWLGLEVLLGAHPEHHH